MTVGIAKEHDLTCARTKTGTIPTAQQKGAAVKLPPLDSVFGYWPDDKVSCRRSRAGRIGVGQSHRHGNRGRDDAGNHDRIGQQHFQAAAAHTAVLCEHNGVFLC